MTASLCVRSRSRNPMYNRVQDYAVAAFDAITKAARAWSVTEKTLSRKVRIYIQPWLLMAILTLALPVLYMAGLFAFVSIVVGLVRQDSGHPDWQGWLGVGFAAGVPTLAAFRALTHTMGKWKINHRLWARNKHHDLLDHWF